MKLWPWVCSAERVVFVAGVQFVDHSPDVARCRHASSGRQPSAAEHTTFTGSDYARLVDRNGARHCGT